VNAGIESAQLGGGILNGLRGFSARLFELTLGDLKLSVTTLGRPASRRWFFILHNAVFQGSHVLINALFQGVEPGQRPVVEWHRAWKMRFQPKANPPIATNRER